MEKISKHNLVAAMNVILRLTSQLSEYSSTWSSRTLFAVVEDIMSYNLFSAALAYLCAEGKLVYKLGVGYSLKK